MNHEHTKLKAFIQKHAVIQCANCLHHPLSLTAVPCVLCTGVYDHWEPYTSDLEAFTYIYTPRHCSTCKSTNINSKEAPCKACACTGAHAYWEPNI